VRLLEDQQKQFLQKGSDMNPQMQAFFRQQAINTLIDRKLLLIEAKKNGIVASEDEIKRNILQSPYFSVNGQFVGMADYQQRVDMLFHMDMQSFEKMVAEDIMVRKYTDLLTAGLLVTDKEVEDQFRKTSLTAKIDYVQFQSSEANDIQVTPE